MQLNIASEARYFAKASFRKIQEGCMAQYPQFQARLAGSRRPLIAVHRGRSGGNIIQNTAPAFLAAIQEGADIVELDISRSSDGQLFVFHDGMERMYLGIPDNITTLSSEEVEDLRLINANNSSSEQKVAQLDEVLEVLKGKALINIDRAWNYWEELSVIIDRHNMADQVLLKSHTIPAFLSSLAALPKKYQFMAMINSVADFEIAQNYSLNMVAVELIFDSLYSPILHPEFLKRLKSQSLLLWFNSLHLNDITSICAWLDDDVSILRGPEQGWGKLLDLGADIIQTDWPSLLRRYIDSSNN